jgi:hypothetical protein
MVEASSGGALHSLDKLKAVKDWHYWSAVPTRLREYLPETGSLLLNWSYAQV